MVLSTEKMKKVLEVDTKNMTAVDGHTAAAQAGTGSAGSDGDVVLIAVLEHCAHVLGGEGLQHGFGHIVTVDGHFVMVIVSGDFLAAEDAAGEQFAEILEVRFSNMVEAHYACASFSWLIRAGMIS